MHNTKQNGAPNTTDCKRNG